jgi:hypothetical protein
MKWTITYVEVGQNVIFVYLRDVGVCLYAYVDYSI